MLKRVVVSQLVLLVFLACSLATGLGGCGCNENKDPLEADMFAPGNAAKTITVVFSGEPPYTGSGLLNDAPIYVFNDNTAAAHNVQSLNEGSKTGSQEYNFAGNYDPKTSLLTGTIKITRNDRLGGEDGTGMTLSYTGALTLQVNPTSEASMAGGNVTGSADGTQVWSYDKDTYDNAGEVKNKANEQITKTFHWTVDGATGAFITPEEE